ncbi:ATP-binding protein [Brevibacillus dissolubilis]|uniref:ATP-binding protein n=1 Tax=Brevibacillus dissolubilis TaxID=1844116 RepID=UPI0011167C66|nr:ATP-binding protein [Brevibacillus dissolubilis]
MIIKELTIKGFGKWSNTTFPFAPGLNLFTAPNEAGKSTLMQALIASLYGMKKDYVRVTRYVDEYERYYPWDRASYETIVRYMLHQQDFRLHRNLAKDREQSKLYLEPELTDITMQYQEDRRKEFNFIERHIGLNRTLFTDVTWIRQDALQAAENLVPSLTRQDDDPLIQRLLAGFEQDLTAIGKKENAESTQLGKVTKQLNQARQSLEQSEQAWESVQHLTLAVARWQAELQELGKRQEQLSSHLYALQAEDQTWQSRWERTYEVKTAGQLLIWEEQSTDEHEREAHRNTHERLSHIEQRLEEINQIKAAAAESAVEQHDRDGFTYLSFQDIPEEEWQQFLKGWYAFSAHEESTTGVSDQVLSMADSVQVTSGTDFAQVLTASEPTTPQSTPSSQAAVSLNQLQSDYRHGWEYVRQIEESRQVLFQLIPKKTEQEKIFHSLQADLTAWEKNERAWQEAKAHDQRLQDDHPAILLFDEQLARAAYDFFTNQPTVATHVAQQATGTDQRAILPTGEDQQAEYQNPVPTGASQPVTVDHDLNRTPSRVSDRGRTSRASSQKAMRRKTFGLTAGGLALLLLAAAVAGATLSWGMAAILVPAVLALLMGAGAYFLLSYTPKSGSTNVNASQAPVQSTDVNSSQGSIHPSNMNRSDVPNTDPTAPSAYVVDLFSTTATNPYQSTELSQWLTRLQIHTLSDLLELEKYYDTWADTKNAVAFHERWFSQQPYRDKAELVARHDTARQAWEETLRATTESELRIEEAEASLTRLLDFYNAADWQTFLAFRETHLSEIHREEAKRDEQEERRRIQTRLETYMLRWGVPPHLPFAEAVQLVVEEHAEWERKAREEQARLAQELHHERLRAQQVREQEVYEQEKAQLLADWEENTRNLLRERRTHNEQQRLQLQKERSQLEQQLGDLREKIARAQGEIGQRGEVSWAKAKSSYEEASQAMHELLQRRDALTLAKDTLQAAMKEWQREVSPDVNELASAIASRITEERYNDVRMDPLNHFSIRVIDPQSQDVVKQEQLSSGTQDQLYFAQRISLLRHLSAEREPLPLFLDDHFIHYDEARLERALKLLLEMAGEHQIFLFSCQHREKAYLEPLITGEKRHRIHDLTA